MKYKKKLHKIGSHWNSQGKKTLRKMEEKVKNNFINTGLDWSVFVPTQNAR